jgi:hypothetical protein
MPPAVNLFSRVYDNHILFQDYHHKI